MGKHLCGAATDYALRGCLVSAEQAAEAKRATTASAAAGVAGGVPEGACSVAAAGAAAGVKGKRQRRRGGGGEGASREGDAAEGARAAATDARDGLQEQEQVQGQTAHSSTPAEGPGVRDGTPRAVGTEVPAGPACDGGNSVAAAEAAAPDGTSGPRPAPLPSQPQADPPGAADTPPPAAAPASAVFRGLAIAPCCHHRCGWRAYVGKPLFRRLGFGPQEFELVSWMTGGSRAGRNVWDMWDMGWAVVAACCADARAVWRYCARDSHSTSSSLLVARRSALHVRCCIAALLDGRCAAAAPLPTSPFARV